MMKLPSQFDITIDNTAPEDTAMPFWSISMKAAKLEIGARS
jgi:hypothetical protein